ncbi:MAG: Trk system potassium transporter TrkA [Clostridia bacterium]|nr:Trk system potassium transporter TrkA [Clostridia bacterium]
MNLVIIGMGKVGSTLVESFVKENHDIVVVDVNSALVSDIVNRFDVKGVVGGGLERSVLLDAGVQKADFLIACTTRDEANILCCVLGKKLGAKRTIARVRDPEYFKEMENMREVLGLDFFFNPEFRTAAEISEVLKFPSALNVENFAGGMVNMVEFRIEDGNPLIGKSVKDISAEYDNKFLIAIVYRGEEAFIPRGDFIIERGDNIHIIATETEIASFTKRLKIFKPRAKTVMIIGGGKIAYYLAQRLIDANVSVKIIENDKVRTSELAEDLPKATVILGDGTEQELLAEEGLKGSDAFVALTGMDEENVIVSLFAKQEGVSKVISKVDKPSIFDMVKMFGLDTVVSPRTVIANHIIRFVRAHQADSGSGINTLYKLHDKVEALEFNVEKDFGGIGVPLKDLGLKRNILIGGIVRGREYILPDGNSKLLVGDKVIVVTAVSQITQLGQILR